VPGDCWVTVDGSPEALAYFMGGVSHMPTRSNATSSGYPQPSSRDTARESRGGPGDGRGRKVAIRHDPGRIDNGIAGPDSDGSSKPVGLTFIAIVSELGEPVRGVHVHRTLVEPAAGAEQPLQLLIEDVRAGGRPPEETTCLITLDDREHLFDNVRRLLLIRVRALISAPET